MEVVGFTLIPKGVISAKVIIPCYDFSRFFLSPSLTSIPSIFPPFLLIFSITGSRYADIEPFYNGMALAKQVNGERVVIDENYEVFSNLFILFIIIYIYF
jgi:hypothetical protein